MLPFHGIKVFSSNEISVWNTQWKTRFDTIVVNNKMYVRIYPVYQLKRTSELRSCFAKLIHTFC